jgi:hypothetical protein
VLFSRKMKNSEDACFQTKAFKTMLHSKDVGKRTEYVESIISIGYAQFEKPVVNEVSKDSGLNTP